MSGFVSLVGAGPGDPELITVKGLNRLRAAEVVVHDALLDPLLLEVNPRAERIDVGKRAGQHICDQSAINELLVQRGLAGQQVVRLKGGDPFVFGRGGEEAVALQSAGVRWEVVPGVSSAIAAPAYAGIPVTHRGVASSVTVVTGHEDPTKPGSQLRWAGLANGADTLVFLMGIGRLDEIAAQLIRHGRSADLPAAAVRWGSTAAQQTVVATLGTLAGAVRAAHLTAPATVIVGEVVRLRDRLAWAPADLVHALAA